MKVEAPFSSIEITDEPTWQTNTNPVDDNRVILSRVGSKDTERLDWLDKDKIMAAWIIIGKENNNLTIREAIDTAMKEAQCQKE